MKIVISNGSFKFHMAPAAAELHTHQILDRFITAGYPTQAFKNLSSIFRLVKLESLLRLYDREEKIPESLITALWLPEIIIQMGIRLAALARQPQLRYRFENWGMKLYAWLACKAVNASSAQIYHYRAGYGHQSVDAAKKKGMLTLCDHSIAHPALIDYLVQNQGRFPPEPSSLPRMNRFWNDILIDIRKADHVLVNSNFVKDTMLFCGFDPSRVHVVYLGVDDQFLQHVKQRPSAVSPPPPHPKRPPQLMYAGALSERKGFSILVQALQQINDMDWHLTIAGGADSATLKTHQAFFEDPRVTYLGTLTRSQLAQRMSDADVFVFPSLVEGSARVIFEAMSAGCFIIATENSGSILKNGTHGFTIQPGSTENTESIIRSALLQFSQVNQIGIANQRLVFNAYRQLHYGQKLEGLYKELLVKEIGISV